jgi:hypothetical protein
MFAQVNTPATMRVDPRQNMSAGEKLPPVQWFPIGFGQRRASIVCGDAPLTPTGDAATAPTKIAWGGRVFTWRQRWRATSSVTGARRLSDISATQRHELSCRSRGEHAGAGMAGSRKSRGCWRWGLGDRRAEAVARAGLVDDEVWVTVLRGRRVWEQRRGRALEMAFSAPGCRRRKPHSIGFYAQEEGKVRVNVVGSRREIRAEFGWGARGSRTFGWRSPRGRR